MAPADGHGRPGTATADHLNLPGRLFHAGRGAGQERAASTDMPAALEAKDSTREVASMETVPQPERKFTRTKVDDTTDRHHWSVTGPAGVIELKALDVGLLGRAYSEVLALHSPKQHPEADESGACAVLGVEDAHCTNYNLLGDKLVRAWSTTRDDAPIWTQLTELYGVLAVVWS